ncbi:SET and MYND domain-containing protein 4 isoform X3 [Carica papaya]|uniref:SET and MYND domain-containing protein 4 isoform X3 n=1 Tax=Carica papaya TaxID=3649 RepID=UPI000B8CB62E|nr:SET and MYND domain-containing protein 4 isoform X3 [Carica papaya]
MERLKSSVPDNLKSAVANGTLDNLLETSSSILDLFLNLQQFHEMVRELVDLKASRFGKSNYTALELKQRGNEYYLSGDHQKALSCYSQALRVAPVGADDKGKNLVATIYVNRAAVLHKIGLLVECIRDCNRAIRISLCYAKAWYRRGKTNISLGNLEDAIYDFTIAKDMESSLSGKRQIQSEMKILLGHHKTTITTPIQHNVNNLANLDHLSSVPQHIELQCVTTLHKGREMVSKCDIPPTSIVHVEDPYSAIISKQYRETHCHYCLNELPPDSVPCPSCAIPLYCSENCQVRAGGEFRTEPKNFTTPKNFSDDLVEYIAGITLRLETSSEKELVREHQHECRGFNWPAILPSDVVLAGRMLVKSLEERKVSTQLSKFLLTLELSHSYAKMPPESKLELHIYSIVLLWCLQHSYSSELSISGVSVSQLRVGQAIYLTGSLFNHSCQPNIHAYFLSRKLFVRATEFVAVGCPLELSYGPEVGKLNCKDRDRFLEDEYFFECRCRGCSEVNISDLLMDGFCCSNPNCSGVVLDSNVCSFEEQKFQHFYTVSKRSCQRHHLLVSKNYNFDINDVAELLLERKKGSLRVTPGSCLKCGNYRDLKYSHAAVEKALIYIERLQDSVLSCEISVTTLSDALRSLDVLKSVLHACSKGIAEVEDNIAQASCLLGDLQAARKHCKASIEIQEKKT